MSHRETSFGNSLCRRDRLITWKCFRSLFCVVLFYFWDKKIEQRYEAVSWRLRCVMGTAPRRLRMPWDMVVDRSFHDIEQGQVIVRSRALCISEACQPSWGQSVALSPLLSLFFFLLFFSSLVLSSYLCFCYGSIGSSKDTL